MRCISEPQSSAETGGDKKGRKEKENTREKDLYLNRDN